MPRSLQNIFEQVCQVPHLPHPHEKQAVTPYQWQRRNPAMRSFFFPYPFSSLSHSLCLRPSLISFPNVKRLNSHERAQIRTAPVHACVCTHVLAHVRIHQGRTNQAKYSAVFGIGLLASKVPVTVYDCASCIYKILTAGICLSGLEKFKINCNA